MLKFSGFHFKRPALLTLAILGLALISVDASAQSETEKEGEHLPKANDRVVLEDNALLQDNISSPTHTSKPATTVKSATSSAVKRDLPAGGVEKEVKKNESPSTLSFNIFLYIVDKFKAD